MTNGITIRVAIVLWACIPAVVIAADSTQESTALHGATAGAEDRESLQAPTQAGEDRSDYLCGRYGLFMFLRLLGHDVPYSEIEKSVSVGSKGSSMLELRDAADRLGISLMIYKSGPTASDAVRLPVCLALIRAKYRTGENGERIMLQGHYVVVENTRSAGGQGQVDIIDGTYGFRETISGEAFASIWTGYYLTKSPSVWSKLPQWGAGAIMASLLLGVVAWRCRRHCEFRAETEIQPN